ncbi:ABC transporter permease [Trichothermofontia sp.]
MLPPQITSFLQYLKKGWSDRATLSQMSGWTIGILALALILALPVLFVLSSLFRDSRAIWQHLATTVLPRYILNSGWLMLGVGLGVCVIGVGTAWLVTLCRFPASRWLEWLLVLPLAAPAYLLAYTYTDLLDFAGPVQTALRQWTGWGYGDYWFPNIRSLGGAIALLTLVLYPYVYLPARVAFLEQSLTTIEASRTLGCGPWQSFGQVALPLARPAIAAGMALALMETLNDFGTVQYFGVDTFTTGIYRTWFGLGERVAATQLAAFLMVFILVLILWEQRSRQRGGRFYQKGGQAPTVPPYRLQGMRAVAAISLCSLPILLGFLLPAAVLLQMALSDLGAFEQPQFWIFARNSLILAIVTATLAVFLALILAYGRRLVNRGLMQLAVSVAAMGYAVPGSVIAVGILVPLGQLDHAIDAATRSLWGISTGLLLSGTMTALVFAYLVRFLAVSLHTIEASLSKIKPSLDDAARSLGYSPLRTLLQVHLPLLRGGLLTAALLVFVDVMKELPATLIIRPFNFDTLAVRVYNLASDERLAEAAAPALTIVLVGLAPVILLSGQIARRHPTEN